jgi:DUF1680 family protein
VYCVEQADLPAGPDVEDLLLAPGEIGGEWRAELLGGVYTADVPGRVLTRPAVAGLPYRDAGARSRPADPVRYTAIPYFAWANRGANPMRVWLPAAEAVPTADKLR